MTSNDKLTPEKIAELKRLCEEATPGPWEIREADGWRNADGTEGKYPFVCTSGDVLAVPDPNHGQPDTADYVNFRLIAATRDALPVLLALVEAKPPIPGERPELETTAERRKHLVDGALYALSHFGTDASMAVPASVMRNLIHDIDRLLCQSAVKSRKSCNWVGGNDYAACTTCGAEYDYRKAARPSCPHAAEPQGETHTSLGESVGGMDVPSAQPRTSLSVSGTSPGPKPSAIQQAVEALRRARSLCDKGLLYGTKGGLATLDLALALLTEGGKG